MQGFMIFNDINTNGKEMWEVEHCDVPKNRIGVWNRPSFQWNTIFKNNNKKWCSFTHVNVSISKYQWKPAQTEQVPFIKL